MTWMTPRIAAACALLLLTACGDGVRRLDSALPPVPETAPDSLQTAQPAPVIPPEEGDAARNPDDPFILAEIDAAGRVLSLSTAGVLDRNPNAARCAAMLRRVRDARVGLRKPPPHCGSVELRLSGPGAQTIVDALDDDGDWLKPQ